MRVYRYDAVEERAAPIVDHFATEMDHFSECIMTTRSRRRRARRACAT